MELSEHIFHEIAKEARYGLRDCLRLLEMHGNMNQRAFLNPWIVVGAVSTWERFVADLAHAGQEEGWNQDRAGWGAGELEKELPWPGSYQERKWAEKNGGTQIDGHFAQYILPSGGQITASWTANVATGWNGRGAIGWRLADFANEVDEGNRDLIVRYMLGAKSARDAAAHRLFYKKAKQAALSQIKDDTTSAEIDQVEWEYVWRSDNTNKSPRKDKHGKPIPGSGRPTIQNGYARATVALFIQLVDATIAAIRDENEWQRWDSRLPSAWFRRTVPERSTEPCAGMTLWNGQTLFRHASG